MSKFPIYLELKDKRVLVVGAGPVATRKVQSLTDAGARVVVIAEKFSKTFLASCQQKNVELIESKYEKQYLAGSALVIAATDDENLNEQIYKDAQQLEILCNTVDDPRNCDFFVPAVVKRGGLQIAIGTDGNCPAYAGHLRKKLEAIITADHGNFLAQLEKIRTIILDEIPDPQERKALLGKLVNDDSFEYFIKNGKTPWLEKAKDLIKNAKTQKI